MTRQEAIEVNKLTWTLYEMKFLTWDEVLRRAREW